MLKNWFMLDAGAGVRRYAVWVRGPLKNLPLLCEITCGYSSSPPPSTVAKCS